jgi:GNAT superfamily N-acetyltransferase
VRGHAQRTGVLEDEILSVADVGWEIDGVGCVKIDRRIQTAHGIRFSISGGDGEIARAYLYVMRNDLHGAPFGLLEDVYVDESQRGGGLATRLVQEVIAAAREAGCYKLIATSRTSRPKVHELYQHLGFENHGVEFRMNLDDA